MKKIIVNKINTSKELDEKITKTQKINGVEIELIIEKNVRNEKVENFIKFNKYKTQCGRKKTKTCSEGCECLHCMNLFNNSVTEQDATLCAVELESKENRENFSETEFQNYLEDSSSDSEIAYSDIDSITD